MIAFRQNLKKPLFGKVGRSIQVGEVGRSIQALVTCLFFKLVRRVLDKQYGRVYEELSQSV